MATTVKKGLLCRDSNLENAIFPYTGTDCVFDDSGIPINNTITKLNNKQLFVRRNLSTTSGSSSPYAWQVNAKLEGYKVANFAVMAGYSGQRMTNAETMNADEQIAGYSSAANTPIVVVVLYIDENYINVI